MRYTLGFRKYWISWFKQDIRRFIYSKIYNFNMDFSRGTLLPSTGKGEYVSVYTKGEIIQIKHEKGYNELNCDEIRIIPCQYNHGIMVEKWKDNKMVGRNLLDINQLSKEIIYATNVEQLTKR